MAVKENIGNIRKMIEEAATESGRSGKDIVLVGASKMNDATACREAIEAGIDVLGENKVQEMVAKVKENAYEGAPLHFIGHLQRNKVRQVVGTVDMIQSVGSLELLDEIEKEAAKKGIVQKILLEVNIGGEESKSGFEKNRLSEAATYAKTLSHVCVQGIMAIPPAAHEPGENTVYFQEVHSLFVDINRKIYNNELKYVSMGMSDDFQDAIRCGSNMVRIGSAIFGKRIYQQ